MSLINQGAILADVPGQTLRIEASRGSFVNQGLLLRCRRHTQRGPVDRQLGRRGSQRRRTPGPGRHLHERPAADDRRLDTHPAGRLDQRRHLVASDATINLDGSFTLADVGTLQRTGGSVQLVGTLDNTATTLTLNMKRLLDNARRTVIGGTIVTTPEASLLVTSNGNNRLDGVTVEGDLTLAANTPCCGSPTG